tara:strand:- start:3933 stop:4247 length:315 start_codon:yes stop_codon:yes gene_type:complete
MGFWRDMSKIDNLEEYITEAIENIRSDRALIMSLLTELMVYIKADDHRHESVGPIAAKYVETLQRSNEQLVKVSTLIEKKEKAVTQGLTELDKGELYDIIKETQ